MAKIQFSNINHHTLTLQAAIIVFQTFFFSVIYFYQQYLVRTISFHINIYNYTIKMYSWKPINYLYSYLILISSTKSFMPNGNSVFEISTQNHPHFLYFYLEMYYFDTLRFYNNSSFIIHENINITTRSTTILQ